MPEEFGDPSWYDFESSGLDAAYLSAVHPSASTSPSLEAEAPDAANELKPGGVPKDHGSSVACITKLNCWRGIRPRCLSLECSPYRPHPRLGAANIYPALATWSPGGCWGACVAPSLPPRAHPQQPVLEVSQNHGLVARGYSHLGRSAYAITRTKAQMGVGSCGCAGRSASESRGCARPRALVRHRVEQRCHCRKLFTPSFQERGALAYRGSPARRSVTGLDEQPARHRAFS